MRVWNPFYTAAPSQQHGPRHVHPRANALPHAMHLEVLSEHAAHLLPYRGLGSGIHRARQAWPQMELQDHRSGNEFRAVVARPQVGTQSIDPVTPPVTPEVTPEVMRLMQVLQGAMSRQELMQALGLKDEKHFRQHYQQAATALGLIEMTLPNKPTSRLQRYRLTDIGQGLMQQERP